MIPASLQPSTQHTNRLRSSQLPMTCCQMYVDVVSGGLLYATKQFKGNKTLLTNYLWVIDLAYRNRIALTYLDYCIRPRSSILPSKSFELLTGCKGLKHLCLHFEIDKFYNHEYMFSQNHNGLLFRASFSLDWRFARSWPILRICRV